MESNSQSTSSRIVVVIPAFNEGDRILPVVSEARAFGRVVVVDDGSNQQSLEIYQRMSADVVVVRHRVNLGKGAALRTGTQAAIQLGAEVIVFMDADGQHRPSDIPRLVAALKDRQLDIVFGSRQIGRDMPAMLLFGNKFLSVMTRALFGIYISDTQSGFRAFRSQVYSKLKWTSPRYAVETEIVVNTGKHKLRFGEVDIQTIYHDRYKGTTVFDGMRIFLNMILWRLS